MNVSYKGLKQELPPKSQKKLDAKFAKLSKLLEKRGEKGAHVVVTAERHLHRAEITVQFYDHQLVGLGSNSDAFTAISEALEKLETQAVKNRGKWREKARRSEGVGRAAAGKAAKEVVPAPAEKAPAQKIYRKSPSKQRKPMTLDEAMMEMDGKDYLVYQDADSDGTHVLVRRRDGHFDLIES